MKIAFFYHSLVSDWNHGNAHFLRGITTELMARGHQVRVYEPENGWSVENLQKSYGQGPIREFHQIFPHLQSRSYQLSDLDLDQELGEVDAAIVHEWNPPEFIARIGRYRKSASHFRLLFHDTHHRAHTEPHVLGSYDFSGFDGVLAYGEAIRRIYLAKGWAKRVWTWHEAADIRLFHPLPRTDPPDGDLVWIGNWGDEERTAEYRKFLIEPVKALGLKARVYGVQYPPAAVETLARAGVEYCGWLPNYKVPQVFSRFRVTLHIPRGPYVTALKGIPTIRPFEALACGIPLVSTPWEDAEDLFRPGRDFLIARSGREMKANLNAILNDESLARSLAENGRQTILNRHTCAHRVDELLRILETLGKEAGGREERGTEAPERRAAR